MMLTLHISYGFFYIEISISVPIILISFMMAKYKSLQKNLLKHQIPSFLQSNK